MTKTQVENEMSEKKTVQDGVDEMNWEVYSKERVKYSLTKRPVTEAKTCAWRDRVTIDEAMMILSAEYDITMFCVLSVYRWRLLRPWPGASHAVAAAS